MKKIEGIYIKEEEENVQAGRRVGVGVKVDNRKGRGGDSVGREKRRWKKERSSGKSGRTGLEGKKEDTSVQDSTTPTPTHPHVLNFHPQTTTRLRPVHKPPAPRPATRIHTYTHTHIHTQPGP